MEHHDGRHDQPTSPQEMACIAGLASAMRLVCSANGLPLREQVLTVTRPPLPPVELEFTGPQPFGFAFTAGHEATFRVPTGHRFVIEHVYVSQSAKAGHADVHLVTKSRYMFRHLTLNGWPEQPSPDEGPDGSPTTQLVMHESTTNTFLFSDGEARSSSTVPPDSYLQVWGYLEPLNQAEGY